ncbi:hypothetical protein AME01nite_33030 [Acidomonas methanolica NBRC 104435]|nr:hypothetical protein AME01nite_33030 [Acidomonas methanolica NBRC 104435]
MTSQIVPVPEQIEGILIDQTSPTTLSGKQISATDMQDYGHILQGT